MHDHNPGKLQIYAVEETEPLSATCIVRCVGGLVRSGQRFTVESADGNSGESFHVTLDWIERYGHRVDSFDPPHNARVHLSGSGVSLLKEGLTIIFLESAVG
ncbi:hypothetical protein BJ965_005519 [Streptomyces luteogriseus]|uniref:Uncharacterized protein n=1 Tax=Streptomyces luteogriseus TaxID=68233 RepID=A0A7W7GHQ0_9ACTN|nr:hypothetical protein [Streptomyces luteogriseus]